MWPQVELLEHHAEPSPHAGELAIGHGPLVPGCGVTHADPLASQEHRAFVRPLEKVDAPQEGRLPRAARPEYAERAPRGDREIHAAEHTKQTEALAEVPDLHDGSARVDRKSTRLNSSHLGISYAVFCLKKKKRKHTD